MTATDVPTARAVAWTAELLGAVHLGDDADITDACIRVADDLGSRLEQDRHALVLLLATLSTLAGHAYSEVVDESFGGDFAAAITEFTAGMP